MCSRIFPVKDKEIGLFILLNNNNIDDTQNILWLQNCKIQFYGWQRITHHSAHIVSKWSVTAVRIIILYIRYEAEKNRRCL